MNNINMCNRSSLIMANFWNGTDGTATFHFNLVRRVFSFSNNEKTLEMSAKPSLSFADSLLQIAKLHLRYLIYFWHFHVLTIESILAFRVNPPRFQSDEKNKFRYTTLHADFTTETSYSFQFSPYIRGFASMSFQSVPCISTGTTLNNR